MRNNRFSVGDSTPTSLFEECTSNNETHDLEGWPSSDDTLQSLPSTRSLPCPSTFASHPPPIGPSPRGCGCALPSPAGVRGRSRGPPGGIRSPPCAPRCSCCAAHCLTGSPAYVSIREIDGAVARAVIVCRKFG